MKGYKSQVNLMPKSQPIIGNVMKIPLCSEIKVREKLAQVVKQKNLVSARAVGATNASSVVWQRKKGELRIFLKLKKHIIGKITDEDYKTADMETIFPKLHGPLALSKIRASHVYYQVERDKQA